MTYKSRSYTHFPHASAIMIWAAHCNKGTALTLIDFYVFYETFIIVFTDLFFFISSGYITIYHLPYETNNCILCSISFDRWQNLMCHLMTRWSDCLHSFYYMCMNTSRNCKVFICWIVKYQIFIINCRLPISKRCCIDLLVC